MKYLVYILNEKIIVFEYSKNSDIGDDTKNKEPLSFISCGSPDPYSGKIIDDYRKNQDENVHRDKGHIKYPAWN